MDKRRDKGKRGGDGGLESPRVTKGVNGTLSVTGLRGLSPDV